MKRGELWTIAGAPHYTGKPRPVLIIQDDRYDATDSVTVIPLTSTEVPAPLFRISVPAREPTGLAADSFVMVDKITTVSRAKLGSPVGRVSNQQLVAVDRAMIVFLGLAD